MSFYESEDYNCEEIDLDNDELAGTVLVPGQLVFSNLDEPGSAGAEYEPKYGAVFRLPKNAEMQDRPGTYAGLLFQTIDHVGEKTWKREAEDKMAAVWDCVDKGVAPRNSNVNIQDGDLHNPEYNAGTWQIQAKRRVDEGPPTVYNTQGEPIQPGDSEWPRQGDVCVFALNVWAQAKRDRINFTLVSLQFVSHGQLRMTGPDPKRIAAKFKSMKGIAASFAKAIPATVSEEIEAPVRAIKPAAKVAAKPVAKKGVFRKR